MLPRFVGPVLAMLVFGTALYGDVKWNQLRQQALGEMHAGQFEAAEQSLRSAIAALPSSNNVPAVVLWNDLGTVEHSRGRIAEATQDFQLALAISAQLSTPDANQSAIAANNLATIAGEERDAQRAEALLRQGSRLLETGHADTSATGALISANLALTMQQQGRYGEARSLYERAAIAVRAQFGEQSFEYARLLANRALFELETGRYGEAVDDGQHALSVQQKLAYVSVFDRALASNNLGFALLQIDDFAGAEHYLKQAVTLWESAPQFATQLISSLNNLGALFERQQRLNEARNVESRAMALIEQHGGVDNLTRAAIWNNLGRTALAQHDFHEAQHSLDQACALLAGGSGLARVRYAAALSNLAALESAEKHYKRAETLYRETLAIDEKELGVDHPEIASDLSNIATQLVYEKRREEALELYEKARVIAEKSFGPVSAPVAHTWRNMAVAYYGNKQFPESAFAYGKALAASPNPNNAPWLHEYALALRKANRFGEAEAAETRALGIEVKNAIAFQENARARPADSGKM